MINLILTSYFTVSQETVILSLMVGDKSTTYVAIAEEPVRLGIVRVKSEHLILTVKRRNQLRKERVVL